MLNSIRRFFILPLLLLLIPILSGAVQAQSSSDLEKIIRNYDETGLFTGSVLVAKNDRILNFSTSGMANYELGVANHTSTVFDIASMSKSFTAALIMLLVEEDKLSLEAPLKTYIETSEKLQNVTIQQLLTHSSGMIDHSDITSFFEEEVKITRSLAEIHKIVQDSSLIFNPGNDTYYSNFGYNLLAYISEEVTGKTFPMLLKEKIFDPLGLENTFLNTEKVLIPNKASGYVHNIFGNITPDAYYNASWDFGAGGVNSTVPDMLKWANSFTEMSLLSKESYEVIFSASSNREYGHGWEKRNVQLIDNTVINTWSHGGLANGFWGLMTLVPDENYFVFLISNKRPDDAILNNVQPIALRALTSQILNILYGKEPVYSKQSLAKSVAKNYLNVGLNKALQEYKKFEKDRDGYYFSSGEFVVLGYDLLDLGDFKSALEIFEIMKTENPNSGLSYECFGDAYWYYKQDKDKALIYYKEALEKTPENNYVRGMLSLIKAEGE